VTMVNFPNMALVEITLGKNDTIILNAPGMDTVSFGIPIFVPGEERLCR